MGHGSIFCEMLATGWIKPRKRLDAALSRRFITPGFPLLAAKGGSVLHLPAGLALRMIISYSRVQARPFSLILYPLVSLQCCTLMWPLNFQNTKFCEKWETTNYPWTQINALNLGEKSGGHCSGGDGTRRRWWRENSLSIFPKAIDFSSVFFLKETFLFIV